MTRRHAMTLHQIAVKICSGQRKLDTNYDDTWWWTKQTLSVLYASKATKSMLTKCF